MPDLSKLVFPKRGQVFIATEGSMKGKYFDEALLAEANPDRHSRQATTTWPTSQRPLMRTSCPNDPAINPGWLAYSSVSAPPSCGHYVSRVAAIELGYTDATLKG